MKLSMAERMRLLSVLPETGRMQTIRIVNDLRLALSPTEEEYEEFGFFEDPEKPNMVFWKQDIPQERDIDISKAAKGIIKDALLKVDEQEQVTADLIPLFDKFVIEEEE